MYDKNIYEILTQSEGGDQLKKDLMSVLASIQMSTHERMHQHSPLHTCTSTYNTPPCTLSNKKTL